MMELHLLNLLFVLFAAWSAGHLAARLGYPSVLGELMAGIILGPPLLGFIHGTPGVEVLAEVGVLLMMLYIGMKVSPEELKEASWGGFLAALGGFITPCVLAYAAVIWFGGSTMAALFVGIAAGVTSLATKSRILADLKLFDTRVAHVLMAGALIADTLSLIFFSALIGVAEIGSVDVLGLALVALKAVVFFGVTAAVGLKLFPWAGQRMAGAGLTGRTFNFTLVLLIAVLFGELAELAGLHAVLGTFIAGLFLQEHVLGRSLSKKLMDAVHDASLGFLAPLFFVTAGFEVTFGVFNTDLGLFLAIMAIAVAGKIVGTALFYWPTGHGWPEGLTIGAGMNGRGDVMIIMASIGLEMELISIEIFSILIFMAISTTTTVPVFLKWGIDWLRDRGELVRSTEERSGSLIVGAGPLACSLAEVVGRTRPVWLIDNNRQRCAFARSQNLNVVCGNALQEQILSEAQASRAESVIVMTPNPEVNTLVARLARETFHIPEVLVVQSGNTGSGRKAALDHLQAATLFAGSIAEEDWDYWISHDKIHRRKISVAELTARRPGAVFEELQEERQSLPLAVKRRGQYLLFHAETNLQEEDELIVLSPRSRLEVRDVPFDRFDRLVVDCPVLDLERPVGLEEFFELAVATLAGASGLPPEVISGELLNREMTSNSVIGPGLAVPHARTDKPGQFHLVIARCREGIYFPEAGEDIHAVFLLIRSSEERNFHLRALSAIAQTVQDSSFEEKWLLAAGPEELRQIVLESERRRDVHWTTGRRRAADPIFREHPRADEHKS